MLSHWKRSPVCELNPCDVRVDKLLPSHTYWEQHWWKHGETCERRWVLSALDVWVPLVATLEEMVQCTGWCANAGEWRIRWGVEHSLILMKQPKSKSMPQVVQKTAWTTNECQELDWVHLRGETPRESDWGCQSIPWLLYTIIIYVHVCIESTNTV